MEVDDDAYVPRPPTSALNQDASVNAGVTPNPAVDDVGTIASPPDASSVTRRIVKLSEETINRIAAGEVVQRPSSALKELLENSIDAGSTSIKVAVKEGGIKLLSIQDNGSGIKKADLPLLCERYATSKLKTFNDLTSIQTYGFRGEALASISHVAHLSVTTKTREDTCGYKARYSDGKLVPLSDASKDVEPRATAANDGTLILVEDLFYNTPTRRKAMKSAADEYGRILDVVSKYAIHNAGIAMTCKKAGSNSADLQTTVSSTTLEVLGQVYSASVRREMNELKFENEEHHFKCSGYVSGANYSAKRGVFIFFINHRLVDCSALKRNLEAFYTALLPKGGSPVVYLALEIHSSRVDVNVSPTKSEVHFLDQDDIIESICQELQKKLSSANQSRTFTVQTLLPGAKQSPAQSNLVSASGIPRPTSGANKLPPQKLVRTDAQAQTLDSMMHFTSTAKSAIVNESVMSDKAKGKRKAVALAEDALDEGKTGARAIHLDDDGDSDASASEIPIGKYRDSAQPTAVHTSTQLPNPRRAKIPLADCDLTSIHELRNELAANRSESIEAVMKAHTFVGVVDLHTGRSMLQHGTRLYLVEHNQLCDELFYQLCLRQFAEISKLKLRPAPSLRQLLKLAMQDEPEAEAAGLDPARIVDTVYDTVTERAEMLEEYFSLTIDPEKGTVESIPLVLPGWTPSLDKLPLFLLRLGVEVDWASEKGCFQSFMREIAFFTSPEPMPSDVTSEGKTQDEKDKHDEQVRQLKHVVFPAMRYLQPPKSMIDTKAIVHVASLENLYKVFERC